MGDSLAACRRWVRGCGMALATLVVVGCSAPTITSVEGNGSSPARFTDGVKINGTSFVASNVTLTQVPGGNPVTLAIQSASSILLEVLLPADAHAADYELQVTTPFGSAVHPLSLLQGEAGPPGPPGPTSVASCPDGMIAVDRITSTLCYHAGSLGNWDQADAFCAAQFRADVCTLQQWRAAVCDAGLPNPGASWTAQIAGTATFATVSGCSGEQVATATYTLSRMGPCCLEWMNY